MQYLTVLGDSIAAGYGTRPNRGFVPVLASLLAVKTRKTVPFMNFGEAGMTSSQLASALIYQDAWVQGVSRASHICILIGGDDVIQSVPAILAREKTTAEAMMLGSVKAYATLMRRVRQQNKGPLIAGTLYNPYPNSPIANEGILAYNRNIIEPAALAVGAIIAPIGSAFAGHQAEFIEGYRTGIAGQPGQDGIAFPIHPNAQGHRVIAEVFVQCLT